MLETQNTMRIAKYIAHCGHCSRREAEKLITDGQVTINNELIVDLATRVASDSLVTIGGKVLSISETEVWIYYKPAKTITSRRDEKNRPTIFDHLPPHLKNFVTIGRLDYNSEGLLLLTNNGDLARLMELPENGLARKYRVRIFGRAYFQRIAKALKHGIKIDGMRYKPIELTVEGTPGLNTWINLTLTEGKNREIRNIISHFDLAISQLVRTGYGPFSLGKLLVNEVTKAPQTLVKTLQSKI